MILANPVLIRLNDFGPIKAFKMRARGGIQPIGGIRFVDVAYYYCSTRCVQRDVSEYGTLLPWSPPLPPFLSRYKVYSTIIIILFDDGPLNRNSYVFDYDPLESDGGTFSYANLSCCVGILACVRACVHIVFREPYTRGNHCTCTA